MQHQRLHGLHVGSSLGGGELTEMKQTHLIPDPKIRRDYRYCAHYEPITRICLMGFMEPGECEFTPLTRREVETLKRAGVDTGLLEKVSLDLWKWRRLDRYRRTLL